MWGDGKQTRSFCYIDDCVEGVLRLMRSFFCAKRALYHVFFSLDRTTHPHRSDYTKPLNIGSDECVTMNQMAEMALRFAGKDIPIKHIPGPEGVRGRNSDNTLIKEVLGWAPEICLEDGLRRTFDWIKAKVEAESAGGVNVAQYASSQVVTQTTESLDKLSKK